MAKTSEEILRENGEIRTVTLAGMFINIFLTIVKVVVGYIGNSQSVIADGIHSLSDCSTDIAVLVGLKYWNQPPDECHPYGHRRIETMVAVFIGIILILAGFGLGYQAIEKFRSGTYVVPLQITLLAAIISIIVKEFLYHWTMRVGIRLKSPAMKANAWHHRTDSLSSIGVGIAIGSALYNPALAVLDPLAAFGVGLFIIQAAIGIMKPALKELADEGATQAELKQMEEIVLSVNEVRSVHALRSRFLGPGLQVDLHLQVDGDISVAAGHDIAGHAKRLLLEKGPGVIDVLVHIEPYVE